MKTPTSIANRFSRALSLSAILTLGVMRAFATTIDFEEFNPNVGGNLAFSSLTSGGFTFAAVSGALLIADNAQPNIPNTGSNTLVANSAFPSSFRMSASSGASFSLNSFLAIEGRNTNTGFFQFSATGVRLLGSFTGGGTISTTLNFDLFAQENNTLDAQLFNFSGWNNLDSILFTGVGGSGYSFGFDNIVVTSRVPDSGVTVALLGSTLLGLAALRRRRTRA